ncbi:hypothetical protein EHS13_27495 [Paenibacillus psychroresistens]|uniref:mannan endo-1,4-beta-mannosidase n=1 Tax=Paenibacillus psychroresistens TaxID=1778678 RepID=A0A6B8RRM0_9BACL|nr:carbohydrate binding domain-containing protein [Paenibacillus psychroresistens]QGQ98362.1 hypothetical protein EHS13_27495 [Paenibacillus psychroresistens]
MNKKFGSKLFFLVIVFTMVLSLLITSVPIEPVKAAVSGFVTRSGSQLLLNGQPFRFGSTNIYWLGLDENVPANTIDFPTAFRVDDALETVKEMGIQVVRSHAVNSFGCAKCIMPTLGVYNEAAFVKLDYAIKSAGDHGIRLILPVVDQYNYYHGGKKSWSVKFFGYPDDGLNYGGYEFYNKREIIDAFKLYINAVLNRTNTYTGIKYKDDPAIMAWETGNELGWYDNKAAERAWTLEIADYMKSLDSNHLVVDGTYGVEDDHLTISSIDIFSDHFYNWPAVGSCCKGLSVTALNAQATKVGNAGRVMYVGEYAWNYEAQGTMVNFLTAIENNPIIVGDAPWAMFGHSDINGYVQHGDPYTIHYPGDTTDMRTKMQQMRTHNYKMQGILTPPAHGIPGAPLITGYQTTGSNYKLTWRGSVPSDKYSVERSTAGSSGPWTVVCNQCATDNNTPWTDSTSTAGISTWYRVKGFNLSLVAGAYSNVFAISGTPVPAPGSFTESAPSGGTTNVSVTPTFSWGASSNVSSYSLVVADNSAYTSPTINITGLAANNYTPAAALAYNKTYYWKVIAVNGTGSTTATNAGISFTTLAQPAIPGAFTQSSPASGSTNQSTTPAFTWGTASGASSYSLVVANNAAFTSPIINASGLTNTSYTPSTSLAYNTAYYWKVTALNATGSKVATNAGISFTTGVQPAANLIDNYEGYGGSNSSLQAAYIRNTSGNAVTTTLDTTNKNEGTYGMKVAYTIGSPNFAGIVHTLGSANWSGQNGISFWLKPDGSNRQLTVQFKESSGEIWEAYYTLTGTTAATVGLLFNGFQHPSWYSGGNGVIDLGAITEFNLYVNQGAGATGSSTLYFDSITTANLTAPPVNTIVDNFESYGGSNASLQSAYIRNASGNAMTPTLNTTNKSEGAYGMQLAYTMGTPSYTGVTRGLSGQNWSGKTGIQLWLKPDGSNRQLTIQFKETGSGETWEIYYTLAGTTAVTLTLPFSTFQHPSWYTGGNSVRDLAAIGEYSIYVNQGSGIAGSSSIYLDAVTLY